MSGVKSALLVGVGGQGAILISKIMANGFMQAGFDVKQSEVHGMTRGTAPWSARARRTFGWRWRSWRLCAMPSS